MHEDVKRQTSSNFTCKVCGVIVRVQRWHRHRTGTYERRPPKPVLVRAPGFRGGMPLTTTHMLEGMYDLNAPRGGVEQAHAAHELAKVLILPQRVCLHDDTTAMGSLRVQRERHDVSQRTSTVDCHIQHTYLEHVHSNAQNSMFYSIECATCMFEVCVCAW